jgi:Na+-driven multidrug efflux pump
MAAETGVLSLSTALMATLVNRYGVSTAAAFGAAGQVWAYIQMPGIALSSGVSSMAAHNVGARKWDRVVVIVRFGLLYSLLLTGVLVIAVEVFSAQAFELFLPSGSEALKIIGHLNRTITWSLLFVAVYWVLSGVVRASGAVMAPLVVLTISLLVVRYPLAAFLLKYFQADAIWWSFSISAALAAILSGLHYLHGDWRSRHKLATPS